MDRLQLGADQRFVYFMDYHSTANPHFNHFKEQADFLKAFFAGQDTSFNMADRVMNIACAGDLNKLRFYTAVNLFPGLRGNPSYGEGELQLHIGVQKVCRHPNFIGAVHNFGPRDCCADYFFVSALHEHGDTSYRPDFMVEPAAQLVLRRP